MSFEGQALSLYTIAANYSAHPYPRLANQDDQADLVIDLEPVLVVKSKAALCHRTQHALFVRRRSRAAGRELTVEEVVMKQESIRRAYPAAGDRKDDRLLKHLSPWAIDLS